MFCSVMSVVCLLKLLNATVAHILHVLYVNRANFLLCNSYYTALEEDARHADAQLRDVWRRQIRNPDERGNPQLSAVLQVRCCIVDEYYQRI